MRSNYTNFYYLIALLAMLCGCHREASDAIWRHHVINAVLNESGTRTTFVGKDGSYDLLTKWQGHEYIKVFLKVDDSYNETERSVQVSSVTQDGFGATFSYRVPDEWGYIDSYDVKLFTSPCFPKIMDNKVYFNASIIREPISEFQVPVYTEGEIDQEGKLSVVFHHYYTYELLHIQNTSNSNIEFSLLGFEGTPWYKEKGSLCIDDGTFVVDAPSTKQPKRESNPIIIKPGESQIIVSAYIPNGRTINEAKMVTKINGEYVHSSNTKTSGIELQQGHAYHMYAGWDGEKLKFWNDEEVPLDVRTLTANIDPQFISGSFTGAVINPPMSELKTGFRFWKEGAAPEEGADYFTTPSDGSNFNLELTYDDFVEIANGEPVEGKYFVSAFAIDAKGICHDGNVLEFTIDSGQPEAPVIPQAVDLGLPSGTKWAPYNVGARNSQEVGSFFAWGETVPKYSYDWTTYKHADGAEGTCHDIGQVISGSEYDVARKLWGQNWSMPTVEQVHELIMNCSFIWHSEGGVEGIEFKSRINGASIFMPVSGLRYETNTYDENRCFGWTGTLTEGDLNSANHYMMFYSQETEDASASYGGYARCRGMTVRPVCVGSEAATPEIVDLGLSVKWASFNLGATKPEEYGDYYAWGETEPYYSSLNPLIWKPGKEAGYDWPSYKWCEGTYDTVTKYTDIELEDDAAHIILGDKWRMPTFRELMELSQECFDKCTWTWTSENGVNGYRVTSKVSGFEGNSIFLPASGWRQDTGFVAGNICGGYWSSSFSRWGGALDFNQGYRRFDNWIGLSHAMGLTIRPVYGDTPSTQPEIEVTPTDIVFGEVPYGTSSTKYVTVKNVGTGVLLFAIDTEVNVPFSVETKADGTPICYSLSAGESIQLAITYTPTSASSGAVGECIICSNTRDSRTWISYSGFGVGPVIRSREYVDLGLSVKWATCNLGASKPEEYGDFYAWGETETKVVYDWSAYKWTSGSGYTKYNAMDKKTVLDLEDDVAHVKLGDNWRMPTYEEFSELLDKCTWTLAYENGVLGYKVTSTIKGYTDNYIFLRTAGWYWDEELVGPNEIGNYWSSSLYSTDEGRCLMMNSVGGHSNDEERYMGLSIRPVYGEPASNPYGNPSDGGDGGPSGGDDGL